MSVRSIWTRMSMWYRTLVVVGIVLTSVGAGYAVVSEFSSHPERLDAIEYAVEANETEHRQIGTAIDSLRVEQRQGNEKLDRVICILEGESPLSCERSN